MSKAMANTKIELPAWLKPTKGVARGSEDVESSDIEIPRIAIIQSLSPQRDKTDPSYIKGAEDGMLFNTVTKELYPENGVYMVPIFYRKEYSLWRPRSEGGGFRGSFATESEAILEKQSTGENLDIVLNNLQYALVSKTGGDNPDDWEEVVVSMSKTNSSVSRKLNADIMTHGVDRFANCYQLSSEIRSNDKGKFFVFGFDWIGFVPESVYHRAEESYEAIKAGIRTAASEATPDDETM